MEGARKAVLTNSVGLIPSDLAGGPSRREGEAASASWPELTRLQKFLQG